MKHTYLNKIKGLTAALLVLLTVNTSYADGTLRRPLSPSQPMLIVHIDCWNSADPQKIIDLIPADIKPYVVFNISLSINHDATTGEWKTLEYGYETAKSWIRTCAQNRVWAMIQPSSGGFSHFPDYPADNVDLDTTIYGEFFRNYPNFIGINYAEQFWGFDDKWSLSWTDRVAHWVNLMRLTHKYGGYLDVSFCGGFWGAGLNPLAMMKRNPKFAAICKAYPENFIIEEKFTSTSDFHDVESVSLGAFLSGYAGHYGVRFDQCGWVPYASESFPTSAGIAPCVERLVLSGETVNDGPELVWQQCVKSLNNSTTADGYSTRRWELFPQFQNISLDVFRKELDGTIRLMDRQEVIDRAKVVILADQTSGDDRVLYCSPETLFKGLYQMSDDGTYLNNKSWFKSSGRYPSIPTVYNLADDAAQSFDVQIKKSAYASRWSTIDAKVAELDKLFPQEYRGNIFAGRSNNTWMTYNPFKSGQTATGTLWLKYNTCDSVSLSYAQYSVGVMKESADALTFYLNNYDAASTSLKTDVIKIYGSSSKPTYTFTDRSSHLATAVAENWSNNVLTLTVQHNGPLDLTVKCAGKATGRLTDAKAANTIQQPAIPAVYMGPRQYEAENFDVKNISNNYASGIGSGVKNYTGMGFINFGKKATASVRDTVNVPYTGNYQLLTKYAVAGGTVNTVGLYINGIKVATPEFANTGSTSTWATDQRTVSLKAGVNVVTYTASAAASFDLYIDNFVLVCDSSKFDLNPEVKIVTPTSGTIFDATETASMEATATSAYSTISHIEFYVNGSLAHDEWVAPYNFEWGAAPVGAYTIKAVAYDADGHSSSSVITLYRKSGTGVESVSSTGAECIYHVYGMDGKHIADIKATSLGSVSAELKSRMHGCNRVAVVNYRIGSGEVSQKIVF
jgi:hypothetical protein